MSETTNGAALIAAERRRQIDVEGWSPEHDDKHEKDELAHAAAVYAWPSPRPVFVKKAWPWDFKWWKPTLPGGSGTTYPWGREMDRGFPHFSAAQWRGARIRDLVKAGALIAAEIDRLQRAAAAETKE